MAPTTYAIYRSFYVLLLNSIRPGFYVARLFLSNDYQFSSTISVYSSIQDVSLSVPPKIYKGIAIAFLLFVDVSVEVGVNASYFGGYPVLTMHSSNLQLFIMNEGKEVEYSIKQYPSFFSIQFIPPNCSRSRKCLCFMCKKQIPISLFVQ